MPTLRLNAVATVLAAVAGLALTACALPFPGRGGPHVGSMPCPTPQTVNEKLGSSVDDVREAPMNDDTLSCVYVEGDFGKPTVNLYLNSDDDRENFDLGRTFMTGSAVVTDIPGFYDSAFTLSSRDNPKAATELQVLHGSVSVSITAVATVDQEKALASHVLDSVK
jgi:hypothetical protein